MSAADIVLQIVVVGFSGWGIYCKWIEPRIIQGRKLRADQRMLQSLVTEPIMRQPDPDPERVPLPVVAQEPVVNGEAEEEDPDLIENRERFERQDVDPESDEGDEEEEDDEDWEEEPTPPTPAVAVAATAVREEPGAFRRFLPQSPESRGKNSWEDFKSKFLPHIIHMIAIGSSGAGKTIMLQDMVQTLLSWGHNVVVCDPDASEGDWEGCDVYGAGDDFEAISGVLAGLVAMMHERRVERANGIREFSPWWFVLDEFGEIVPECAGSSVIIGKALRRARKLNIHIVIGVQDTQVKTMGFERQSALLQNTRIVRVVLDSQNRRTLQYGAGDSSSIQIPVLTSTENTAGSAVASASVFRPVFAQDGDSGTDLKLWEETPKKDRSDGKEPLIMQMLEDGESYNAIAAKLQTSTARIARAKHKLDLLHAQADQSREDEAEWDDEDED